MGVTFKPEKKSNSGVKFTPENPDTPITNKYQDYFEPKEIDLEEDETSFPQALNLGAQQGLTAFHADELKDKLYNYLLKRKGLPEDTTYLPQVREEYVKAKEDRPWTTLIGNVGGGILGATGAAMAAPYLASSALPVAAGTSYFMAS